MGWGMGVRGMVDSLTGWAGLVGGWGDLGDYGIGLWLGGLVLLGFTTPTLTLPLRGRGLCGWGMGLYSWGMGLYGWGKA